jgi:adenylosuccinate lyase
MRATQRRAVSGALDGGLTTLQSVCRQLAQLCVCFVREKTTPAWTTKRSATPATEGFEIAIRIYPYMTHFSRFQLLLGKGGQVQCLGQHCGARSTLHNPASAACCDYDQRSPDGTF